MRKSVTLTSNIPVYIPTFNNPTYLINFIKQLEQNEVGNIVVVDNNSTYLPMKECLSIIEQKYKIIRLDKNFGPHYLLRIKEVYDSLPNLFCLSDPDLELSKNLPHDFINELLIISNEHRVGKVGPALEIPPINEVLHTHLFLDGKVVDIIDYEKQFWRNKVGKSQYDDDLYLTTLDTQFALYNKAFFDPANRYPAIRVAGRFTSRHLSQLKSNTIPAEEVEFYKSTTRYSYFGGNLDSEGQPSFEISVLEYTKMVEQIQSLESHIISLDYKIQKQNNLIQDIFKSKRWRLMSTLLRILGRK